MEETTIQEHIDMFVTSYSRDLGPDGLRAVEMLTAAV
jgi:predicted solute-binding protein